MSSRKLKVANKYFKGKLHIFPKETTNLPNGFIRLDINRKTLLITDIVPTNEIYINRLKEGDLTNLSLATVRTVLFEIWKEPTSISNFARGHTSYSVKIVYNISDNGVMFEVSHSSNMKIDELIDA